MSRPSRLSGRASFYPFNYHPRAELLEDRTLLTSATGNGGTRLPDPRNVVNLDASWRFIRTDVPGAQQVNFDDSSWDTVNVPHTWNNLDGQQGGSYYRGIGWYRQHDVIPADWAGQELFLKFDGASLVTDLYVNGTLVGEHRGGFAAFTWDVTAYLAVGQDNVLAVKVNNLINLDVPPLYGDFNVDGGLYRHVNLIATNPLHVSLTDYASPGVFLRQTNVSAASADLQVTTKLQNDDTAARDALVQTTVVDADGNVVTTLDDTLTVDSGMGTDVVQDTTIKDPHLWDGRNDPYMYQVCVQVIDTDSGVVVDQVEQPLGFRFYSVDPNNGFYLNGRPYNLHGVDFHQDRFNEGWAISDDDQRQDVGLAQEIGATFVRLAHYQHPPLTYDLLDQDGIVTWSEIPLVDGATNSQAFFDNTEQQLTEMILQNYNHPAVMFWGMYNEINDTPVTESLVPQLVQLAHNLDPDRLTTAASDQPPFAAINFIPDVISFNNYFGWYYGQATDFAAWADNIHRTYPDRVIGQSEYGAGASIYQHQENAPEPLAGGPWHPEEYQDFYHETVWQQLETRPFLWETSVWNLFDFAVSTRHEGDTPARNDKGLVTADRQTKKDAFYWYKANWSSDPVLYITSRDYVNRPSDTVDVKVYSNLDQVELIVDGVSLGTLQSSNHIFQWTGVTLAPGKNDVKVTATQGGLTYTDKVTWYTPRPLAGQPFAAITFQPSSVPVPAGYVGDYGLLFGDRGNGYVYGWDVDNSANTVVRHLNPDARYDRLELMQAPQGGRVWEIAVPDGVYDVHVVAGDPASVDSIYQIAVNGVLAISGALNIASPYQEAWRRVRVTDGLITLTSAARARDNKINFIEINQIRQAGGTRSLAHLAWAQRLTPALVPEHFLVMQNGGASRTTLPAVFPAATGGNPDDQRPAWTGPDPFRSRMLLENRWRREASPAGDLPDPLEEEKE
jgi:beta-galactosidase